MLLILPSKKEIYPLSTVALTQAQWSPQKLRAEYTDAYLLDSDGTLCRIEEIQILGPYGDSWLRKIVSRLTDSWRTSVRLSGPIQWDIARLKSLILECLEANEAVTQESYGANTASVIAAIKNAEQSEQVFSALKLPKPDEALDVL